MSSGVATRWKYVPSAAFNASIFSGLLNISMIWIGNKINKEYQVHIIIKNIHVLKKLASFLFVFLTGLILRFNYFIYCPSFTSIVQFSSCFFSLNVSFYLALPLCLFLSVFLFLLSLSLPERDSCFGLYGLLQTRATEEGHITRNVCFAQEETNTEGRGMHEGRDITEGLIKRNN